MQQRHQMKENDELKDGMVESGSTMKTKTNPTLSADVCDAHLPQLQAGKLYYPKTLDEAPAYIFQSVAIDSSLTIVPDFTLQPRSFLHKVLKFLFVGRVPLNGKIVELLTGYKGYHWLSTLQPTDRLLLNGVTNLRTLRAIKWLTPKGVRCFQYFNNCLRFVLPPHQVAGRVREMQRMGYKLVSFDPHEAEELGMTYAPQFYRFPEPWQSELEYDFFFCGERKNRGERLDKLRLTLEQKGFRCLFIVVGEGGDRRISYQHYLEYVRKSRCLVDLFQEGQVGLTRRPLEALFFNKKLLTENLHIQDFDFYCPENTFIMGKDDIGQIKHFLNATPAVEIPDKIKRRYDVFRWLHFFT